MKWGEAKRSLSDMHEKRGEQGSWFKEERQRGKHREEERGENGSWMMHAWMISRRRKDSDSCVRKRITFR